jgi:hypothetical protein
MQNTVYRQYTTGFPGDIVRDGPKRAKPARIASATVGTDPGASTNRISRAFGFTADIAGQGPTTYAAMEQTVSVGGAVFFGILGHPKHYALQGSAAGGTLGASLDLPQGFEGEFFDMVTGMVAELINETTATKVTTFGDQVAFVPTTITALQNPNALPYGALVSVPAGASAPAGMILIPNARVMNSVSANASGVGALVSVYTIIQLTQ